MQLCSPRSILPPFHQSYNHREGEREYVPGAAEISSLIATRILSLHSGLSNTSAARRKISRFFPTLTASQLSKLAAADSKAASTWARVAWDDVPTGSWEWEERTVKVVGERTDWPAMRSSTGREVEMEEEVVMVQ